MHNVEINTHFKVRFTVLLMLKILYMNLIIKLELVDNQLSAWDESVDTQTSTGNLMNHSQRQCLLYAAALCKTKYTCNFSLKELLL